MVLGWVSEMNGQPVDLVTWVKLWRFCVDSNDSPEMQVLPLSSPGVSPHHGLLN